jgi:hypothetical protein
MSVYLPLRTDATPHYSFEVSLEGATFTFEFRWNSYGEFWVFDLSDSNGDLLLAGRRVTVRTPLLGRFKDTRMPAGELMAFDTAGGDVDPTLEDLGTRVAMVYLTADDVTGVQS